MRVGKRAAVGHDYLARFTSPVEIDEEDRKFITYVAEKLELEIPDEFFDLGNLGKDVFTSNPLSGLNLKGTPEEECKYWKIIELNETISKALEWSPVERAFSGKRCMRLAVQNCGKAIDEDVEIAFEIPQKALLTLSEFPSFKNNEMGYLLNDCNMSVLFGINSTAEYIEYSKSERSRAINYIPQSFGFPDYAPDYSESFTDELNNIFCYSIYPQGDKYIIKLKVDYIKHNTVVAFPTVLFIKEPIEEITYKITSKDNPNISEGILKVQSESM